MMHRVLRIPRALRAPARLPAPARMPARGKHQYVAVQSASPGGKGTPKAETVGSTLDRYNVLADTGAGRLRVVSTQQDGVTVQLAGARPLAVKGPAILTGSSCLLWDVPQFGRAVMVDRPETPQGHGDEYGVLVDATGQPAGAPSADLFNGWSPSMFALFELVAPAPEIVLIGTGATAVPLPENLRAFLANLGIQCETMSTVAYPDYTAKDLDRVAHLAATNQTAATATFNVLQEEQRPVAACLLPAAPTSARTGQRHDVF